MKLRLTVAKSSSDVHSDTMSHPFGDLLSQHLHRKHGLSQAKLVVRQS
jgi:hypothetical protein